MMRPARTVIFFLATFAFAAVATAAPPPPAGWVEEPAAEGTLHTLRHGESQAGLQVSRVQLESADVERFQRNLQQQLAADGIEIEAPAAAQSFAGHPGTVTRYTKTVLDIQFTILVVDVHHKNSLLHAVAWLRPTDEISEDALEKDVLSYVVSLVK